MLVEEDLNSLFIDDLNLKQYAICERAIEKPQIWLASKGKRLEKSRFVDAVGDVELWGLIGFRLERRF